MWAFVLLKRTDEVNPNPNWIRLIQMEKRTILKILKNRIETLKFRMFFFRYRSGQEAMVVCDIGYEIRSSASGSKIQCKEDGSWQPAMGSQFPICQGEQICWKQKVSYTSTFYILDLQGNWLHLKPMRLFHRYACYF